jgi:hypothetical protein
MIVRSKRRSDKCSTITNTHPKPIKIHLPYDPDARMEARNEPFPWGRSETENPGDLDDDWDRNDEQVHRVTIDTLRRN